MGGNVDRSVEKEKRRPRGNSHSVRTCCVAGLSCSTMMEGELLNSSSQGWEGERKWEVRTAGDEVPCTARKTVNPSHLELLIQEEVHAQELESVPRDPGSEPVVSFL